MPLLERFGEKNMPDLRYFFTLDAPNKWLLGGYLFILSAFRWLLHERLLLKCERVAEFLFYFRVNWRVWMFVLSNRITTVYNGWQNNVWSSSILLKLLRTGSGCLGIMHEYCVANLCSLFKTELLKKRRKMNRWTTMSTDVAVWSPINILLCIFLPPVSRHIPGRE